MAPLDGFRKRHRPVSDSRPVSADVIARYADRLPAAILEEWKRSGWCAYGDGFLWTTDPAEYVDVMSDWLPSVDGIHALLRTAFGGIVYWDGTDMHYLDVLLGDTSLLPRRADILFDGTLCDDDYLNDVLRLDLFQQARPKLGKLTRDECYGFLPPLALGGPGTLDTLSRVDLSVHLALLAQAVKS
jgi:hypothetical protein